MCTDYQLLNCNANYMRDGCQTHDIVYGLDYTVDPCRWVHEWVELLSLSEELQAHIGITT